MRSLTLPVHNISDRKYSSWVTASKLNKRYAQINTLFAFCFWFVPGARPVLHRRTNSFGGVGPTDRVYSPNRQHKPNHFLPVHACSRFYVICSKRKDKLPTKWDTKYFFGLPRFYFVWNRHHETTGQFGGCFPVASTPQGNRNKNLLQLASFCCTDQNTRSPISARCSALCHPARSKHLIGSLARSATTIWITIVAINPVSLVPGWRCRTHY